MKLGIAIPLKAKAVSKNWKNVEKSLLMTLNSIKNQLNQNFIAFVIGHDKPSFFDDTNKFSNNIIFIHFSKLTPPLTTDDHDKNLELFELDRCSKIFEGYKKLLEHDISHFFPLDADDLLSNDLVSHIKSNEEFDALLIENGFVYYQNKRVLNKINNFNTYCGSSMIASIQLINSSQNSANFEEFLFRKIGHVMMKDYLIHHNVNYKVPEARLMMYIRDNGDNISRYKKHNLKYRLLRTLKMLIKWIPLRDTLKEKFSLTDNFKKH